MSITNTSKPTTSIVNTLKASFAETWDTWDTAWQDETRTWNEMVSLLGNLAKPSTSITNISKP